MRLTIRQAQKALSRGMTIPSTTVVDDHRTIGFRISNEYRAVACVSLMYGQDLLQQHAQHRLVQKVMCFIQERSTPKLLSLLARRYGAHMPLHDALHALVADMQHLCGIAIATDEVDAAVREARKKDTSEVDGSTQTGDETHGGDSASGEVPDGHSGGGASPPHIADTAGESRQSLKKAMRQQQRQTAKGGGSSAAEAVFGDLDRGLVKRAKAAFAALVSAGASGYSPRYDHQQLVERLFSHRSLQAARREETGRPVILVIADVSGSCASFADPACRVAQACGASGIPGADIVTVRVTNIWSVEEVRINNQPVHPADAQIASPAAFADWLTRTCGNPLEVVIGLGDSDEFDTYEEFASQPHVERLIWLDNYGCNRQNNTPTPRRVIAAGWHGENGGTFAAPMARRKLTYLIGCGDADAMVRGLERAIRGS